MEIKKLSFIVWIIIAAMLTVCMCAFPFASFIIMPLSGVFFTVRGYSQSYGKTFVLMAVSLAVCAAFGLWAGFTADAVFSSVSNFFLTAVPGSIIGMTLKAKSDYRVIISGGTIAYLMAFIAEFIKFRFFYKIDITDVLVNQPLKEVFSIYTDIITKSGIENADAIAEAFGQMQWYMQQAMAAIIPSVLIIMCAAISFIVFLISRKFLFKRYGVVLDKYPHFWQIRMPKSASFILAVLYIVTMFMSTSTLAGALTNILIILSSVYMVCGLSVVDSFFRKTGIGWLLRTVIYAVGIPFLGIFGMILPIVNVFTILLFLGVIDGIFDFRRLAKTI